MELAIVIAIIALAALAVGLRIRRTLTGRGGCGCGHECSCSGACAAHRTCLAPDSPSRGRVASGMDAGTNRTAPRTENGRSGFDLPRFRR